MNDVLVYDDQVTPTADSSDDQLLIANGAFGIQKTKLSNLMGAAADGALPIDGPQLWTLKYASENPNGGPLSLKMHDGKLYAALGFLGIGIYDPATLAARRGAYNLYADCKNTAQEDWFGYPKRKIACPDASLNAAANVVPMGVDADGMPTYLQAANELGNKNSLTWYPWAEFDRYGKYYYKARTMDLVDIAAEFTNWHDQDGGLYRLFAGRPGGGGRHRPDGTEVRGLCAGSTRPRARRAADQCGQEGHPVALRLRHAQGSRRDGRACGA